MSRYVYTNITTKDANKLISFYKEMFHCKSISETCDLHEERVDRLTGLHQAHITEEHLLLPGYGEDHPTLGIFSYDTLEEAIPVEINRSGLAHLAFEMDDVEEILMKVISKGGSRVGELIIVECPNDLEAAFVYAKDPEGNTVKLQSWRQRKEVASK